MFITQLRLHNIRNFRTGEFEPARGLNVFVGDNGSGKTSLMEAVFLLGRGRSFRTAHLSEVLTTGESEMWGFARAQDEQGGQHSVGLEYRRREGITAKVDGQRIARLSELARVLPVLFLGGERSLLLNASPQERREFLDWGLFHVEPTFLALWRRYSRALSQRNAALRANRPNPEVELWDGELSDNAMALAQLRTEHAEQLLPNLVRILDNLAAFPVKDLKLELDRGWPTHTEELRILLQRNLERDRQLGYTRSGPHRFDWELRIQDRPVRQYYSAGQQKILVCGLLLAQVRAVAEKGATPVLCLDDLPAELDAHHRELVLGQLHGYGAQIFVSATDAMLLDVRSHGASTRVFHVEHGTIGLH